MKKGQKHSVKTKLKLSIAHMGIKRPGIGGAKKGRIVSTQTKKLQSVNNGRYWLGKKRPEMSGVNNHFWGGGVTSLAEQIRKSVEYFKWRSYVFERDHYTCIECGISGVYLHADHIKQFAFILNEFKLKNLDDALKCVELWDTNNGRTLCVPCHRKIPVYSYKGTRKITFTKY